MQPTPCAMALAVALCTLCISSAEATPAAPQPDGSDIHYSGPLDLDIPNANGLSINWRTGEYCYTGDACTPSEALLLQTKALTPQYTQNIVPAFFFSDLENAGAMPADNDELFLIMQPGDTVHSGLNFGSGYPINAGGIVDERASVPWQAGVDGYLGFRFRNLATHQVNYGYVHIVTTAPLGFPATLLDYAYDTAGHGITIPGGTKPIGPTVQPAFAPERIATNELGALTITLHNADATDALLSADFVDALPEGLFALIALTDCPGGSATVGIGGGSIALAAGTTVPAESSCRITAYVSSAAGGHYTNRIQAGSLQTDHGANPADEEAALLVAEPGSFPPDENFDDVTAPSLPPTGWQSVTWLGYADWKTVDTLSDSGSNAVFTAGERGASDTSLVSPPFVPGAGAGLSFRQAFDFEASEYFNDGGDLEISIDGGEFRNFPETGGSFIEGGYNAQLLATRNNPLAGRIGWGSYSGDWFTTTALFSPATAGHTVQLRWRMGTSDTMGGVSGGWWLDTIHIDAGIPLDALPPRLEAAFVPARIAVGGSSTFQIELTNATASPVTLTSALSVALPNELTVGNATTTCDGEASLDGYTLTLASGAAIPAQGSCRIAANISATDIGAWPVTIQGSALHTSLGDGSVRASARLAAIQNGDCVFADGFDADAGCDANTPPGTIGTYSDFPSFIANLAPDYYQEYFDTILPGQTLLWTAPGANGYGFTLSNEAQDLPLGLYNSPGIVSTDSSDGRIIVTFTGNPVTAVGGNFWATDIAQQPTGTQISIQLSNGSSQTFISSGPDTFRGFVTSEPITSLRIDAPPSSTNWPNLANLVVGRRNP